MFDNPIATVWQELTLAFSHFLRNMTIQQCYTIPEERGKLILKYQHIYLSLAEKRGDVIQLVMQL